VLERFTWRSAAESTIDACREAIDQRASGRLAC